MRKGASRRRTVPPPKRGGARTDTLPTIAERRAAGKALRNTVGRTSHAGWEPPRRRRDPIDVLIESSQGRLPNLVPIRYGRMLQSPFTFFRGAAAIMARDLAQTPVTGLRVQACGDCHLLNLGGFATPERQQVFDINDFDETLPAPWEWDLKRLAASFVIAGRSNRFAQRDCRAAAAESVRAYRTHMSEYAEMDTLDAWYARVEGLVDDAEDPEMRRFYQRMLRKEEHRDAASEFAKLTHDDKGVPRITDDPPLIFHPEQEQHPEFWSNVRRTLQRYRDTLPDDKRVLFDRYRFFDIAIKVVGVGSVGTICGVALFLARQGDPLFLQIKEARRSVLEPFAGKSVYANHGERVVVGQRVMQTASDIFLGWTVGDAGRHFYVRQLRDLKLKPVIEVMRPENLIRFGTVCGWALARAHARSGDTAVLSGYMGKSAIFDNAVADFAEAYADQNERDHAAMVAAARAGRIEVRTDV